MGPSVSRSEGATRPVRRAMTSAQMAIAVKNSRYFVKFLKK
jgi:hypothetical protein